MSVETSRMVLVLRAILEGPTKGPVHLCHRLHLHGTRMRPVLECFEELRSRGLVMAPAESGSDHWTVTPAGRDFLEAHASDASGPLMRGFL